MSLFVRCFLGIGGLNCSFQHPGGESVHVLLHSTSHSRDPLLLVDSVWVLCANWALEGIDNNSLLAGESWTSFGMLFNYLPSTPHFPPLPNSNLSLLHDLSFCKQRQFVDTDLRVHNSPAKVLLSVAIHSNELSKSSLGLVSLITTLSLWYWSISPPLLHSWGASYWLSKGVKFAFAAQFLTVFNVVKFLVLLH